MTYANAPARMNARTTKKIAMHRQEQRFAKPFLENPEDEEDPEEEEPGCFPAAAAAARAAVLAEAEVRNGVSELT